MSISKYFSATCLKPIYLDENRGVATNCGFINGLSWSVLLTILVLVATAKFHYTEIYVDKKLQLIYLMIAAIVLIWVIVPQANSYIQGMLWDGYEQTKRDLKDSGLTQFQIFNMLGAIDVGTPLTLSEVSSASLIFASGERGKTNSEISVNKNDQPQNETNKVPPSGVINYHKLANL